MSRLASDLRLMLRRPERLQFAALCYRWTKKHKDIEVLLITSRDTGRWVIPKGWPMQGCLAHVVAEREALEEAGMQGKATQTPIGDYDYLKALNGGIKVPCKVQVHAMEVEGQAKDFKEKGVRRLEWVSCEEAAKRVTEPGLKELILSFCQSKLSVERKKAKG
jgi:8-oxo-dGTP pyrophosphatase MutT (NUDIX family)